MDCRAYTDSEPAFGSMDQERLGFYICDLKPFYKYALPIMLHSRWTRAGTFLMLASHTVILVKQSKFFFISLMHLLHDAVYSKLFSTILRTVITLTNGDVLSSHLTR